MIRKLITHFISLLLNSHNLGYNGMLCQAGDFEDFYKATKAIVLDHDMRRRMSQNARKSSWKYERNVILQEMLENY